MFVKNPPAHLVPRTTQVSFDSGTTGQCVASTGNPQKEGMVKLENVQGKDQCLKKCMRFPSPDTVTACEFTGPNSCYVHTGEVGRSNGKTNHFCYQLAGTGVGPSFTCEEGDERMAEGFDFSMPVNIIMTVNTDASFDGSNAGIFGFRMPGLVTRVELAYEGGKLKLFMCNGVNEVSDCIANGAGDWQYQAAKQRDYGVAIQWDGSTVSWSINGVQVASADTGGSNPCCKTGFGIAQPGHIRIGSGVSGDRGAWRGSVKNVQLNTMLGPWNLEAETKKRSKSLFLAPHIVDSLRGVTASSVKVVTDMAFSVRRDDVNHSSTITYLDLNAGVEKVFSFSGSPMPNSDVVTFDGTTLTCTGEPR